MHVEDLVLHNERMDVRTPTHEITRAHAVLRARRRIAESDAGWALTSAGLNALRGRSAVLQEERGRAVATRDDDDDATDAGPSWAGNAPEELDLADEFAAIDAVVERSRRLLSNAGGATERASIVYDPDWDEDVRLDEWLSIVDQSRTLPPVLTTAIALDAWDRIDPLQHSPWLGPLLVAGLLRERKKTRAHLLCLNSGLRLAPRERRRASNRDKRLASLIEAVTAAAETGMQDHDRWFLARRQLERKLVGRRSTSKLPGLIDFVMSRPIASAGMIAKELSITPRAAQDLVVELGLREATGKGRYRAWGIF